LREDLGRSRPARYAVVPEKRRVPGRIRVTHLEVKNAVQGRRKSPCPEPDRDRLKPTMFPHLFPESLEIFDSLTPRKPRRGVMSLDGPRVRGGRRRRSPRWNAKVGTIADNCATAALLSP
jgi:hypothetical protein